MRAVRRRRVPFLNETLMSVWRSELLSRLPVLARWRSRLMEMQIIRSAIEEKTLREKGGLRERQSVQASCSGRGGQMGTYIQSISNRGYRCEPRKRTLLTLLTAALQTRHERKSD